MSCQCPLQSGINKGKPCPRQAVNGRRFCVKHQKCGRKLAQHKKMQSEDQSKQSKEQSQQSKEQSDLQQLPNLTHLPELALLNILRHMSVKERKELVDGVQNDVLYRLQREIDRDGVPNQAPNRKIAQAAIKELKLSRYKINIDNLLEHLLHLNNYKSYDSSGVKIYIWDVWRDKFHMIWTKGSNRITYEYNRNTHRGGVTDEKEIWTIDHELFRKYGPCSIKWEHGNILCLWDGCVNPQPQCPLTDSSPIIDWVRETDIRSILRKI